MKGAPVCKGETLPEHKCTWCVIAGSITCQFSRECLADAQHINYMNYTQYAPYGGYSQYYGDSVDDGQGNGEGLSPQIMVGQPNYQQKIKEDLSPASLSQLLGTNKQGQLLSRTML